MKNPKMQRQSEMSTPQSITPYLYYEDVAGAMSFLAKAFGMRRYGRPMYDKGKVRHAAMTLANGVVMMGHPGAKYKNPRRLGQATQCLLIHVDGVDQHFAQAVRAGATILKPPEDQFFGRHGQRRYGASDLEGHEWYFAQAIIRREPRKWT